MVVHMERFVVSRCLLQGEICMASLLVNCLACIPFVHGPFFASSFLASSPHKLVMFHTRKSIK